MKPDSRKKGYPNNKGGAGDKAEKGESRQGFRSSAVFGMFRD